MRKIKKDFFLIRWIYLQFLLFLGSATMFSKFCGARIRESWSGTSSGHVCRVSNFRHSTVATGKLRRSSTQPISNNARLVICKHSL